MSLPLRYQLTAALVSLNVVGTAVLAGFAYRASRESLENQASHTVGVIAEARDQALTRLLDRRKERMEAFLGSATSLCAERTPSGRLAFERECVRSALIGFQTAERATAAELRYRGRRLTARGTWPETVVPAPSGQLALVGEGDDPTEYTMQAELRRVTVRVRFNIDDLNALFQDRSGLEAHGEVILTDARGYPLTDVRYPTGANTRPRALNEMLQPCLAGSTAEIRTQDYRGVEVISGFRPASAIGAGCIVANLHYADALVPIHRLGRLYSLAAIGFILIGAVVSLIVARKAAKPIDRLAVSARALEAGQFDAPVPIAGPSEVRQLGRALSSMARAVGDLVQREHEARIEAEGANRTKDDFLAMLSHELRTPLTAILGWTSILSKGPWDQGRAEHAIDVIERSARTQARLIDELFDVSSIISGKLRLNGVSQVSLSAILDAALEAVRPSAEAKRIDIVKRVDARAAIVSGDAGRLQQVVANLLSNGVRFTPEGGRIEVEVADAGDCLEIHVKDSGIGIAPEFLPHMFEPFRQADTSTTRERGGLGLGLAIARHLVELHAGTLRAESAGVGLGSTFSVRLPRSAVVVAHSEPGAETRPPVVLEGARVLVVDDDANTREVLRAILEGAGAMVATTASAAETRAFMKRVHPDLLIADIGMPKEDGYSLIRSVRALDAEDAGRVPAIALTAHARPEDVARALESGFQMHLAKPIDSSRLLSAVAMTLVRAWPN